MTASNFRDSVVYPGGAFALETALAWLHEIKNQELGGAPCCGAPRAARVVVDVERRPALGKSDSAAIGEPCAFFQDWLAHGAPDDPWWDPVDFGRRLDNVPPATFIGGWYDLFLRAQVADYEALRHAGRTARLTIGPWTTPAPPCSPRRCATDPDGSTTSSARGTAAAAGAPVRLFVMGSRTWQEFSMWPPAGEPERWYLGRSATLSPDAAGGQRPDRYHYNPHDPTPATGGAVAQHDQGGAQGSASPRASARRPHLHQPRPDGGPHRHRPAHGHALPALDPRAHRFLRAPLRRVGEGQVVQPE